MSQRRLPELDGIRGLAILMVLIWHYARPTTWPVSGGIFTNYLIKVLSLSWSGVDLFFVLSGFLIIGILLEERASSNVFQVFYTRRVLRIVPPYAILVMFYFLGLYSQPDQRLAELFDTPLPVWSYLFFMQNIFMGLRTTYGATFLSVTWSLAIEEQFYLIIPFLIVKVRRFVLPGLFVTLIVLAVSLRATFPGFYKYVWMPFRMDSLLLGGVCALWVKSPRAINLLIRFRWTFRILLLILLLGAWIIKVNNIFGFFDLTWLALLYALLILLTLTDKNFMLNKIFRFQPLVYLGVISYSVYLYHQVVSFLLHSYIRDAHPTFLTTDGRLVTLLAFIVTILIATLSYYILEKPLMNFGKTLAYKKTKPEPTS